MRINRSSLSAAALGSALAMSASLALAQTTPTPEEIALRQRVEDLERKLQLLEQRLEQQPQVQQSQAQQRQAGPAPTATVGADAEKGDAGSSPARAVATPSQHEEAMQKQIDQLSQQVSTLATQNEKTAAAAKPKGPVDPYARNGIALNAPGGDVNFRFRALLQVDYRDYFDPAPGSASDSWIIRRARPILEGTAYENFDFRIMPDFGNNQTTLPDAYIDANLWPQLKFRVGKFKPPVGLERLQSPVDLLSAERALISNLVPNRDFGLQASGDVLGKTLNYAVGFFNGAVDNTVPSTVDNNNSKDYDFRLFATPFRNTQSKGLRGLSLGIAYTTGNMIGTPANGNGNSNLPSFLTTGQQTFFTYNAGAFANGQRERLVPQLYYSWGPFQVLAEYAYNSQRITRATNTQTVDNNAWQVAVGWVLTGEDATYRGVLPKQPFNMAKHTWGSWMLTGRYHQLTVDNNAFIGSAATQLANPHTPARKASDWGLGLRWDLSREVAVMFDFDQTAFVGGAANGGNRPDEKVLITRFQYSL